MHYSHDKTMERVTHSKQTLVDLSPFHSCLSVRITHVASPLTSSQVNKGDSEHTHTHKKKTR